MEACNINNLNLLLRYTGFWKNDEAHGKGTINDNLGNEYTGECNFKLFLKLGKFDKANGLGVYKFNNGVIYVIKVDFKIEGRRMSR